MIINKRCRALHDMEKQAQALIDRVHRIIKGISNSLGLRFGLQDVQLPTLFSELRKMSPCREDNLHRILQHLQDECRLDLGLLLEEMRSPLNRLELHLKRMDLDAVQNSLEGEDTPPDLMTADMLNHLMRGLDSHLVRLHHYRVEFKDLIEEAGSLVVQGRADILDDIGIAEQEGMAFHTVDELIAFGESHVRELVDGRDIHDLQMVYELFDQMKSGAYPFIGAPVFETLEMLDECIEAAKIPTAEEECVIEVMEGDVMLFRGV